MSNPFVDRHKKRHSHGQRSERKTAKRLDGRSRPGSGAVEGAKGDIDLPAFLAENKTTEHKSLSLKLDWLEKIDREAREEGKSPALSIQFVDKMGNPLRFGRWVLITEDDFRELSEET